MLVVAAPWKVHSSLRWYQLPLTVASRLPLATVTERVPALVTTPVQATLKPRSLVSGYWMVRAVQVIPAVLTSGSGLPLPDGNDQSTPWNRTM